MKINPLIITLLLVGFLVISCKTAIILPQEVAVTYTAIPEIKVLLPIQKKFGELLQVAPETIENIALYQLIDEWMETPYVMGGETKEGIDCSSFTQLVYTKVYDQYIERTAATQFSSDRTDKFRGQTYLKEGDLLFFTRSKKDNDKITHVGMYLDNDRFVHATAHKGMAGYSGVKVSNIKDFYWQSRFVAGGRKIPTTTQQFSSN